MVKKRDRLEVIRDILKRIHDIKKIRSAKLLRSSNLSPQMFKGYISELLDKKFIVDYRGKGIRHFSLTPKGEEFLREYKTIENMIFNFGL